MPRRRLDTHTAQVAAWLAREGESLAPDRRQAECFLQTLDPHAAVFSFRTFSDTPYTRLPGRDPLEHAIHGSLSECWRELTRLNQHGAGIAVTINATNGRGRTVADIQRVRALFVDDDDPSRRADVFPIPPNIQVCSSPGRYHAYWLVDGVSLDGFQGLQQRLAQIWLTDTKGSALNHAMGLPGFWRRKQVARPILPRLVFVGGTVRLSKAEFERVFRLGGACRVMGDRSEGV